MTAPTNLSNGSGILKNIYDYYVERVQNLQTIVLDEIAKSAKKYNAAGNGFFGAINDYGNESGGAINETEQFRSIDYEHYEQWKVTPKIVVWPVEFSGLATKAAEGNEESFANMVVDAIDMARKRLRADENRQFFGIGTGLLCKPSGSVASNLTSFTVDSIQYLRNNMVVDIYSGSNLSVSGLRVTAVDPVNSVVYLGSSVTVALTGTEQLVKQNIRVSQPTDGKEMMGLRGIVDDGTDLTTFQNLTITGQYLWRSVRIDASAANLTSDLLQRLGDDVEMLSGDQIDFYITHHKQRRKYLDLVVPEKRFQDGSMDAGFTKLSFNGKEFILDKDCQTDTIYAGKKSALRKFEVAPLQMAGYEGSDKFLRLANYDAYQTYWYHYINMGVGKRNCFGKITNLAKPTGISGSG